MGRKEKYRKSGAKKKAEVKRLKHEAQRSKTERELLEDELVWLAKQSESLLAAGVLLETECSARAAGKRPEGTRQFERRTRGLLNVAQASAKLSRNGEKLYTELQWAMREYIECAAREIRTSARLLRPDVQKTVQTTDQIVKEVCETIARCGTRVKTEYGWKAKVLLDDVSSSRLAAEVDGRLHRLGNMSQGGLAGL